VPSSSNAPFKHQVKELRTVLTDGRPKLGATTANAVCGVLCEWSDLIPPEALTDFIEFLASELCFDPASSIYPRLPFWTV
jgi:hypothetical protein